MDITGGCLVVNLEGGVGKSTLAMILAEYLAFYMGKKILAIDFDSQANFSTAMVRQLHIRDELGKGGLEPPRIAAPDPKSGPSASSGTPPRRINITVELGVLSRTIAFYKASHKLLFASCKGF